MRSSIYVEHYAQRQLAFLRLLSRERDRLAVSHALWYATVLAPQSTIAGRQWKYGFDSFRGRNVALLLATILRALLLLPPIL